MLLTVCHENKFQFQRWSKLLQLIAQAVANTCIIKHTKEIDKIISKLFLFQNHNPFNWDITTNVEKKYTTIFRAKF